MIDSRTAPYAATLLRCEGSDAAIGPENERDAADHFDRYNEIGERRRQPEAGRRTARSLPGRIRKSLGLRARGIESMVGAIVTVHGPAGFFFNNPNGGWEYPAFWIVGLVAVALLGDGAYALRPTFAVPSPSFAR